MVEPSEAGLQIAVTRVRSRAVTCKLCHHEALLPADGWGDGVLICALLYPKLRAAMANPLGESKPSALRLDFDRRLMLQFRDSLVLAMLDCWSMVYRELDDALGLTGLAGEMLADARMGSRHRCSPASTVRAGGFLLDESGAVHPLVPRFSRTQPTVLLQWSA